MIKRRDLAAGRGLRARGPAIGFTPGGCALLSASQLASPTPEPGTDPPHPTPRRRQRRAAEACNRAAFGGCDGRTDGRTAAAIEGRSAAGGNGNAALPPPAGSAMDGSDNATLLFALSSLQPDNYTLSPNASSLSPGPDVPGAPASSAGPSAALSLGPGPGASLSPGPTPTPKPTGSSLAGGAEGLGASPFPRPGAPHEPPFWDTPLNHGLNVLVGAALCITMLGLGCTVDVNHFGAHVRRPLGAGLAALCQFGILPLLAFLLALVFSLNEVAAVAVLLCGCCPGGNLSNLMSLLVDGDMNLRYGAVCSLGIFRIPTNRV